ncbi:MAG: transglutaminase domain-containing protein [Polyangiaceae bacterium]
MARSVAVVALYVVWTAFVVLTPVLGAWFASSLAAYGGGKPWAAALIGLLLFPILPGAWEAFAEWRFKRRPEKLRKPHILTLGDRVLLRTLFLNLTFLVVVLAFRPQATFRALAARGDWVLDGSHGATANGFRRFLFGSAERLEWLYRLTDRDPYSGDGTLVASDKPPPMPHHDVLRVEDPRAPTGDTPTPTPTPAPASPPRPVEAGHPWPSSPTPHPLATSAPADAERSVDALAQWATSVEPDRMQRFKLLHDWVATHVDYDVAMLKTRRIVQQDADSVLSKRVAVCAGYSKLLEALGKKAGFEITYVAGHARTSGSDVDGERHAWNVVVIDGTSYLVDSTWDAGYVGRDAGEADESFHRQYTTDFLFAPAEVFGVNHFPDEAKWQLRSSPISRGDFVRQPVLSPKFFAAGLKLVQPDRSHVTAAGSLSLAVERSSEDAWLMASAAAPDGTRTDCEVNRGERFDVTCAFPAAGKYDVILFFNTVQYGTYWSVGSIDVVNDP